MSKLDDAVWFAAEVAHRGQVRRGTGLPYVTHANEVLRLVKEVAVDVADENVLVASVLHDAVEENPKVTYEVLARDFGVKVADIVLWLTNPSKDYPELPRAERKKMDREHLAAAPFEVRLVKLLDRAANVADCETGGDRDWQRMYLRESEALLGALRGTHAAAEAYLEDRLAELKAKVG